MTPESHDLTVGRSDEGWHFLLYRWHYKPSGSKIPLHVATSKGFKEKAEMLKVMNGLFPNFKEHMDFFQKGDGNEQS
jgi:hypothetical protein